MAMIRSAIFFTSVSLYKCQYCIHSQSWCDIPLLVKLRSTENGSNQLSTVDGGRRVERPDNTLDLGHDPFLLLGGSADHGEGTSSLSIETQVLIIHQQSYRNGVDAHFGERLAEDDLVTLLNKVSYGKSVTDDVTRSETLVSHVKQGKMLLSLEQLAQLLPLLLGRVDTCRVLSTGMEKDL